MVRGEGLARSPKRASKVLVALLDELAFRGQDQSPEAAKMQTECRLALHRFQQATAFVFEVGSGTSFPIP